MFLELDLILLQSHHKIMMMIYTDFFPLCLECFQTFEGQCNLQMIIWKTTKQMSNNNILLSTARLIKIV